MAATPLTLMDDGLASATVTADANATLDSASAVAKTAPSSAIRPTMLFGSTERLDTSASMLVSPHGSSGANSAATSPSFLPEMPQWKKDLIQRRKSNVARTIGAAVSPTSAASAAAMQQQRYSLTGGQLQSPTTATGQKIFKPLVSMFLRRNRLEMTVNFFPVTETVTNSN
ncbi:uncharacterized protein LOC120774680 [Bactrocera tryoni]|uniref:uncharacterized protein LOC120774680 n=1 Tax=Bactrocera tryoni TaxID=59916 RepID=UPI001A988D52|nr:uncharacterized protein LOC120774680 [Bactrocera tryoni]